MRDHRRTGWVALVAAVTALHLALLPAVWPARLGEGAADPRRPARLQVSFVQTLQPSEPPTRRLQPVRAATRAAARSAAMAAIEPVEPAASAADLGAPGPPPMAEWVPKSISEPMPASANRLPAEAAALAVPPQPPASAAAGADATTFDWPPSTRLSYLVVGDVQGPVEGQARVEWLRQGLRYQVHLDLSVALLASRRISSDGVITPAGLAPRRYDEETRIVLREPRRVAIDFGDELVRMADGRLLPRPEGVQDSASQFVQMTWLFNARPDLLQPGRSVSFPLALPRRIDSWTYDILASEPVATPAGLLPVVHVRPRREAGGGDLTVEFWVAPSLQYLPVRLAIRQGRGISLDLLLERLPEQATPGR
ncbi:MAG: hypothetical protein RL227_368 [Pseudomonadota bacterium]|jgi:hypothetical protein